ncbi:polysaccharide deacetylase family protein [Bdellovibrio sp. HCB337]|uniref:polysaccharide deacetylase family protein n=1 Tax=Bdellovibrio sp. HCB337 TaxID=3394358 RepID=UPI0039A40322
MKHSCYIIFVALGLLACTKATPVDFNASIDANKNAKSLLEWDSSEENPKKLFQKYREQAASDSTIGKTVCDGLAKLNGQDLSLFEEEINSSTNAGLLKDCKSDLKKTLEDYWKEQKESLKDSTLNFRFQPRAEKRDLSKGYRAATGDVQPKELVLSFDDGPEPSLTPRILDILEMVQAKVMFFHVGPHVRQNPAIVKRAALDGHIMGSHSMTHRCLASNAICAKANNGTPLTFAEAEAEIRGGHQALQDVLGFVDPFFRFPFGESDPALSAFLASRQVGQFYWNVDSGDWKAQDNKVLLQNVLAQIDKVQRGIVLFHDTQRRTLEILPHFLRAIYDRGYTLVVLQPMDEQARYNSQLVTKAPIIP